MLSVDHVDIHLEWVIPDLLDLTGMKTTESFSQAAYLRLLIPELLPDIDRTIYLDSDLVVERDLGELSEIEMGDVPALAVRDYMYPSVSCLNWVGDTYQSRGLSPNTPYLNSGVLVMNLQRWRTDGIAQDALGYMRDCQQFVRWADQDGINAVLAGNWGRLDDRWNVMLSAINSYGAFSGMSRSEMKQARRTLLNEAFILHFAGPVKPWRFAYKGRLQSRFFPI